MAKFTIKKEPLQAHFLGINVENVGNASGCLKHCGLKLYLYLMSNSNGFTWNMNPSAFANWLGADYSNASEARKVRKTISDGIEDLKEHGFLKEEDLDVYTNTIRSLTPERPSYSLTYRFRVGEKYEFVKESGKRIFEDPNSNVILGFARKVEANHFEKTSMSEIDSARSIDELLATLDTLYSERRIFQLVCVNLTTLPDINNRSGRAVGNMIMNEYLKRLKSNFMSDSGVIYRASGLVFYFIITDTRKMEFFKRGLTADPNS